MLKTNTGCASVAELRLEIGWKNRKNRDRGLRAGSKWIDLAIPYWSERFRGHKLGWRLVLRRNPWESGNPRIPGRPKFMEIRIYIDSWVLEAGWLAQDVDNPIRSSPDTAIKICWFINRFQIESISGSGSYSPGWLLSSLNLWSIRHWLSC